MALERTAAWDARPSTPARARSVVADVLERAGHEERGAVALLLTSELVTNAVVHAGGPVDIRVGCDDHVLRVEVQDGSASAPRRVEAAEDDEQGRGMHLVDALASDWGHRTVDGGKVVWFDLALE
jgi:anti-sigma regulatory factor (Ser/Thr protein kinase)